MQYRDLMCLLAKRNLTVKYKQTILGPLWHLILPVVEALVSAFVFGNIAKISSGTVPYFLFFYVGATLWYLFSSCLSGTGTTFASNARMFQKVYFPRLVVPFSTVLSNLFTFGIRFSIMLVFLVAFGIAGADFSPAWNMIWLLPILFVVTIMLALGIGLIFSALTAKYRDLAGLLSVFIDLLKYVTPVVYTVSTVEGWTRTVCMLNPMASLVEAFRYVLMGGGNGSLLWLDLCYATIFSCVVLFVGLLLFNRTEKNFVDLL